MTDTIMNVFSDHGALESRDAGRWNEFTVDGSKVTLRAFDFDGCAQVSQIKTTMLMGLLQAEMVVCTPYGKDMPVYTMEMFGMGRWEFVRNEIFNTLIKPLSLISLYVVNQDYKFLKTKKIYTPWYNFQMLDPVSSKIGKRRIIDQFSLEMTEEYLKLFDGREKCFKDRKLICNRDLVDAFTYFGGPFFDTLMHEYGKKTASEVFHNWIFRTR